MNKNIRCQSQRIPGCSQRHSSKIYTCIGCNKNANNTGIGDAMQQMFRFTRNELRNLWTYCTFFGFHKGVQYLYNAIVEQEETKWVACYII